MESNGLCKPKLPPFQLGTQVEDVIASGHAFTYTSVDGGTSYRLCARFDQYARMKSLFGIGTGVGSKICFSQESNLSILDRGMLFLKKIATAFSF